MIKAIAALVGVLMFAVPASSSASQTIGQVPDLPADYANCTNDEAYLPLSVAALAGYSPSSYGVITSWSAMSKGGADQTVRLMVFRDDGADHFSVVAKDSSTRTLGTVADLLNTFSGTRIPIEANQRIGVYLPAGSRESCEFGTAVDADHTGYSDPFDVGEPPDNVPFDYSAYDTDERVNARAVVEPDADRDLFGDETQDKCVGTPGPNNGCPPATPHKKKCKKHKKRSASSAKKKHCKKKKKK